ncbi:Glycosyltransferase family 25 (LPS biosynthesis protein) [Roseovarius albus]|uniref:Glycosyltransferase family 25 (LPS biosynthesis protein) n=1 Tax=Roseovarius albus TaxID=1247867 RepID=A0A1X7A4A7_9RHOB|nr:glycosyltransferase family 25 protein [Roseovarius albus]SLN68308.1 Glycosyltransferase family 25 (LPS biosynthesis protein) [Roseovarius albus]
MTLHAFVLHLARAEKRRANAHEVLASCGVEGEIWDAVDGAKLSEADIAEAYRPNLFEPKYPFALKTGEVGCFLSHRSIWQAIVDRELEAGLVFEDDASLDPDVFGRALALAQKHIDRFGYIQFQTRYTAGHEDVLETDGDLRLSVPRVSPVRATAQLISLAAAKRLVKKAQVFDRPVDTFVQSHWFTGQPVAVIYPSGVEAISESLDGSTIQGGKYSLSERLKREVSRTVYRRKIERYSRDSKTLSSAATETRK